METSGGPKTKKSLEGEKGESTTTTMNGKVQLVRGDRKDEDDDDQLELTISSCHDEYPHNNNNDGQVEKADPSRTSSVRSRRRRKKFRQGLPEWKQTKLTAIESFMKVHPVDVTSLCQLAISKGGLLTDDVRRKVWPYLIDINMYATSPRPVMQDIQSYRDYNQVVLDVNRCVKRFPPGIEEHRRLAMQDQLIFLIVRILIKHPELHYYQGFHDICITFLLAVGDELAFALVEKLSLTHLRDFMDSTMEKTSQMLNYLYPLLGRINGELREHMEKAGVGTIFCLSWLITWFGHVLNDYKHIVRLYDFFLACHSLMPIYLAAAIVLYREDEILEAECDMATLHSLLSKVPDDLPFEDLIVKSGDIFLQHPPADLVHEVEELNRHKFMGLREPENYPQSKQSKHNNLIPIARSGRRFLSLLDLRGYGQAISQRTLPITPYWLRQRRTLYSLLLCTVTVSMATAIYSYMTQNNALEFIRAWYSLKR